jgi:hypothetical protein
MKMTMHIPEQMARTGRETDRLLAENTCWKRLSTEFSDARVCSLRLVTRVIEQRSNRGRGLVGGALGRVDN